MVFGHVLPSTRGNLSPQQLLDIVNIYLENASRVQDPDVIFVLCYEAEVSLSQTKKAAKAANDQAALHGIATAYVELGRVLNNQGHHNEAEAIHKKAEKLG